MLRPAAMHSCSAGALSRHALLAALAALAILDAAQAQTAANHFTAVTPSTAQATTGQSLTLSGELGAGGHVEWATSCGAAFTGVDPTNGADVATDFDLSSLAPGTYVLCARAFGFTSESVEQTGIVLTVECLAHFYESGGACVACAAAGACTASEFYTVSDDLCSNTGGNADTNATAACQTCGVRHRALPAAGHRLCMACTECAIWAAGGAGSFVLWELIVLHGGGRHLPAGRGQC